MPILRGETSIFPESLLNDELQESASDRRWLVFYTKPRQEKSVARDFLRRQIPFYLPLVKKSLQYGRRTVHSRAPLFGGYIFSFATEAERVTALATNRIVNTLTVNNREELVTDLRQIRRLIAANVPLTIESRLAPGDKVRVRKGAFAGMEGTVLRRRGETHLLVCVNFLQRGASFEIEDFQLEPLD
jgi:transcriptional antiterminator RfaH